MAPWLTLTVSSILAAGLMPRPAGPAQPFQEPGRAGPGPEIIARVGDEQISGDDLAGEVNRLIPENFFHAQVSPQVRQGLAGKALQSLIERSLIHQDALAAGLTATGQEIQAEFARTLQKAGPPYDAYGEREAADLLEQYRPLVVRRILLDKNEARFEASVAAPSEDELRQLYDEHASDMMAPEEARFLHIQARVDPAASSAEAGEVHANMVRIEAELAAGTPFGDLAREYSDDIYAQLGGDMGFVTKGAFITAALDRAAFALKDGETSGILSTLYGFHLIRRVETRPPRRLAFEEAKEGLRLDLLAERRTRERAAWIEGLKQRYSVQVLSDPSAYAADTRSPVSR